LPYFKLTNGAPTPYSLGQLRKDNPEHGFPLRPTDEWLADWDVYPYTVAETPDHDPITEKVVDDGFSQGETGAWFLNRRVVQRPEEQVAQTIRTMRDQKLRDTDWLVIRAAETGVPLSDAWSAYRQALRDVPSQAGFPYNVTWPTEPE
jgi:hypothetical protein